MKDILDELADNVRNAMIEAAAKVSEIHTKQVGRLGDEGYEYDVGWNDACRAIGRKIRELAIPRHDGKGAV